MYRFFTGSTTAYWYHAQRTAEEQRRLQEERKRKRALTGLLNCVTAAYVIVFVVGVFLNEWRLAELEANPLVGLNAAGLERIGGTSSRKIAKNHEYWRLISSIFVNAGVIQLWANVSALWAFTFFVGTFLSALQISLIFLGSGVAGVLVSANINEDHVTAGASGAIFGCIGAALAVLLMHFKTLTHHFYSITILAIAIAVHFFVGATPFVDNSGNVAGLFEGIILGFCFLLIQHQMQNTKGESFLRLGAISCGTVALGLMVLCVLGLVAGLPAGGCCRAWVCTPSPFWDCNASRVYGSSCMFTSYINQTVVMTCPRGTRIPLLDFNATDAGTLNQYCSVMCASSEAVPPAGGSAYLAPPSL